MESAVSAKRHSAAPGKPSKANQNRGAITESLRFSAKLSSALSRTCTTSSTATSRLTIRANCCWPACSDCPNCCSTAATSSVNIRHASKGLSATPSSNTAQPNGNCSSSHCSPPATNSTSTAPSHQTAAPRQNDAQSAASALSAAPATSPAPLCPITTRACNQRPAQPR